MIGLLGSRLARILGGTALVAAGLVIAYGAGEARGRALAQAAERDAAAALEARLETATARLRSRAGTLAEIRAEAARRQEDLERVIANSRDADRDCVGLDRLRRIEDAWDR